MKLKNLSKKIAKWGFIFTSPFWPLWIEAPTELVSTIYPNVKNRHEAYQILEEEKQKLGIQKPVDLRIYDNNELREVSGKDYDHYKQRTEEFIQAMKKFIEKH